jgi:hypothetical protein
VSKRRRHRLARETSLAPTPLALPLPNRRLASQSASYRLGPVRQVGLAFFVGAFLSRASQAVTMGFGERP